MKSKQKVLLLEDVEDLGKSGEIVSVKAGFLRNYLFPKSMAVIADKHTLRMQEKLQKERALKAVEEKKESEELAKVLSTITLTTKVKVDPEGKMYGSVSALDISRLFQKEGIEIERRHVILPQPIKMVGVYDIHLKLKEGVPALVTLEVVAEESAGV